MKKMHFLTSRSFALCLFIMTLAMTTLTGCKKEEENDKYTGKSETYTLNMVSNPAINGKVTFKELKDMSAEVTITLVGTSAGMSHPAHIHAGATGDNGPIAVTLTSVEGATGMSVTTVNKLDNGTALTYNDLINYAGYVNVHKSLTEMATLIAQGDIGGSMLTTTSKQIDMAAQAGSGMTGRTTFTKRKNGNTLISISVSGTTPNVLHPAHIHRNTDGSIAVPLTHVNGTTGKSLTNISATGTGAMTYEALTTFDGYVNVHKGAAPDPGTVWSRGNIK